jgi:hypothetical protein
MNGSRLRQFLVVLIKSMSNEDLVNIYNSVSGHTQQPDDTKQAQEQPDDTKQAQEQPDDTKHAQAQEQPDVTKQAQEQSDVTKQAQEQSDVTKQAQEQSDITKQAQVQEQPDVTKQAQAQEQPDVTKQAQEQPDDTKHAQAQEQEQPDDTKHAQAQEQEQPDDTKHAQAQEQPDVTKQAQEQPDDTKHAQAQEQPDITKQTMSITGININKAVEYAHSCTQPRPATIGLPIYIARVAYKFSIVPPRDDEKRTTRIRPNDTSVRLPGDLVAATLKHMRQSNVLRAIVRGWCIEIDGCKYGVLMTIDRKSPPKKVPLGTFIPHPVMVNPQGMMPPYGNDWQNYPMLRHPTHAPSSRKPPSQARRGAWNNNSFAVLRNKDEG